MGLGTKIVSSLLAVIMIGAILKVKLAIGFLGTAEMAGYELDLALLVIALFLAINGSKLWLADRLVFSKTAYD